MCSTAYKKQWAPDRRSLILQKLRLFTLVATRIKSKGLPIGGPLLSKKNYTFYMRSTANKKQGALGRRSTSSITFSTRFATY
jgi:hypothetical protein